MDMDFIYQYQSQYILLPHSEALQYKIFRKTGQYGRNTTERNTVYYSEGPGQSQNRGGACMRLRPLATETTSESLRPIR